MMALMVQVHQVLRRSNSYSDSSHQISVRCQIPNDAVKLHNRSDIYQPTAKYTFDETQQFGHRITISRPKRVVG
jgi:hypothetical protein